MVHSAHFDLNAGPHELLRVWNVDEKVYETFPIWFVGEQSPIYRLERNNSTAEVKIVCKTKHLAKVVAGLIGRSYLIKIDDNNTPYSHYISRDIPHRLQNIGRWGGTLNAFKQFDNEKVATYLFYCKKITSISPLIEHGKAIDPYGENDYHLIGAGYLDISSYVPTSEFTMLTCQYGTSFENLFTDELLLTQIQQINNEIDPTQIQLPVPPDPLNKPWEWYLLRNIKVQFQPLAEFIQLPGGYYKWVDDLAAANDKISCAYGTALQVPSMEITVTWLEVPFIPRGMRKLIGSVNRYAIFPALAQFWCTWRNKERWFHGFPAGTLLYVGCAIQPYRTAAGELRNDITYRFKYMGRTFKKEMFRGHNHFIYYAKDAKNFDPSNFKFQKITDNGEQDDVGDPWTTPPQDPGMGNPGKPIYPYADLRQLFTLYCD